MEAKPKISGRDVRSAPANQVSAYEQKLLSMTFVGIGDQGRYIFRFIDDPLKNFIGDYSDFCDWCDILRRTA